MVYLLRFTISVPFSITPCYRRNVLLEFLILVVYIFYLNNTDFAYVIKALFSVNYLSQGNNILAVQKTCVTSAQVLKMKRDLFTLLVTS